MAQAKTGGLSCGWVEPTRGEGLYWGDKSREQGASAWKLARAFGKSADSLGGANECRALLTVLYPGSGRSLAASCPSCPCEMWKINRLEGADGSKHTHTHNRVRTHSPVCMCRWVNASPCIHTYRHAHTDSQASAPTLRHKHTQAWLTMVSHHEGSSQAKPWGLGRDDSRLPAGSSLNQPGGAPHQNRQQNCNATPQPSQCGNELVIISLWLHEEYNLELQEKCKTQKSFIKDVYVFFP